MTDLKQPTGQDAELRRVASQWSSVRGLDTQGVPWRLWEKAKQHHWDPADLDFSQDAEDWKKLSDEQRLSLSGLARGFMVGEEGVTLDVLPLVQCVGDLGWFEDAVYLTSFAYEEAKHVDFFRRWFDAVGCDLAEMDELLNRRRAERGLPPLDREAQTGLFERELPRVMRRAMTERSREAIIDATVTYNQFVEGCLALAGYRIWGQLFESFGVMPALQAGLGHVRTDESRHITYGTYLARRIIGENPELFDRAAERMYRLRDRILKSGAYGSANDQNGAAVTQPFVDYALDQVERRVKILAKAVDLTADEAAAGVGAEEEEAAAEAAEVAL